MGESNFNVFFGEKATLPIAVSLLLSNISPLIRPYLVFSNLAAFTSISSEIHFSMVAHKKSPPLTDKYAPIPAKRVNQGALHAQWDKVNDRKIKRGRGSDLPSQLVVYLMTRQCLLH